MQSNLPISDIITTPVSQPGNLKHFTEDQKNAQAKKTGFLPLTIPLPVRINDRKANKAWTEDALYQLAQTTYLIYTTQHNDIADRLTMALADDQALANNKVIDLMHYYMNFHQSDDNINEYLYGHCYQEGKLSNLNCVFERPEFNSVPTPRIEAFINVVFGIRYINTIPDPDIKQELEYYQENTNPCDIVTWNYLFGLIKKDNSKKKNDLFERYYPKAVEQKTFRRDVLKFVIDHFLSLVEEIIHNRQGYEETNTQAGVAEENHREDSLSLSTDRTDSITGSFISFSTNDTMTSNQSSEHSQSLEPQDDITTHTSQSSTFSDSNESIHHAPTNDRKIQKTLNTMKYPPTLMDAIKRHIDSYHRDSYKEQRPTDHLLQNNETVTIDTEQKILLKRRLDKIKVMFSHKKGKADENPGQPIPLQESLLSVRPRRPQKHRTWPETN